MYVFMLWPEELTKYTSWACEMISNSLMGLRGYELLDFCRPLIEQSDDLIDNYIQVLSYAIVNMIMKIVNKGVSLS